MKAQIFDAVATNILLFETEQNIEQNSTITHNNVEWLISSVSEGPRLENIYEHYPPAQHFDQKTIVTRAYAYYVRDV